MGLHLAILTFFLLIALYIAEIELLRNVSLYLALLSLYLVVLDETVEDKKRRFKAQFISACNLCTIFQVF